MRYFKHFIAFLVLVGIGAIPSLFLKSGNNTVLWSITVILLVYQVISFANRSNLKWKNFYTSKLNLLTSKKAESIDFNFDQELLFEKVIEVMQENNLKVESIDYDNKIVLGITSVSLKSWGENIYLTVNNSGSKKSKLLYESVAFGFYSWGKNEDNAKEFFGKMEESLII